MAILNKIGIENGGTIQAEHVTRTIDALTGVSTDTIIATGSFTGSFTGTASFATTAATASKVQATLTNTGTGPYYMLFADNSGTTTPRVDSNTTYNASTNVLTVTSSYATTALTASHALNAPSTTYTTLNFFHEEMSGVSSGSLYYFGGFGARTTNNPSRVGLIVPYTGTITSTWVTSHCRTTDTGTINVNYYIDGVYGNKVALGLDLSLYVDKAVNTSTSISVTAGDVLTMEIEANNDSAALINVNVGMTLES